MCCTPGYISIYIKETLLLGEETGKLFNKNFKCCHQNEMTGSMTLKHHFLKYIFLFFISLGAFPPGSYAISEATPSFIKTQPHWFEGVRESLKVRFDKDRLYFKTDADRQLHDFYKRRDFQPVWLTRSGWGAGVEPVIETLRKASLEGLDPTDYEPAIVVLKAAQKETDSLLEAEVAFTKAVLDYIDDLGGERMSPRKIGKSLYIKPDPVDAAAILYTGMAQDQTGHWLASLTVHKPQYQALKKLLVTYRQKAVQEKNRPTLPKGPLLKKGKKSSQVPILRQILRAHGDVLLDGTSSEFDQSLEDAVKRFQQKVTLDMDGIVGPQTRRALNKTSRDKVDQIIATMERWRWLPEKLEDRHLMVNIAAFDLKGYEYGKKVLDMPVIIGRQYRKTPVFTSSIYSIRFNPSWHVPRSIAVKDKLKKIRKDPSYLTRGGYVLMDTSGQQISPHSVNWSEITSGSFNYRLRQRPGAGNALGKIRFSIRSPFNVYLHSTPDKHLFEKKVRSFSSGCIRVARPAELAFFVFNEPSKWTLKSISAEMEGNRTRNVKLDQPVPVYISYFTVWVDEEGQAHFMDDIYDQDAAILKAIKDRHHRARLS
tara:strand:+ start:773 stop:2560 length:1788 start_codon:yes stop_codon:yes gene_type:complete